MENSPSKEYKKLEFEKKMNISKILKDEVRLTIAIFLSYFKRLSFQQIVGITGKSKSTISYHIDKLISIGIVQEVEVDSVQKAHGGEKYYCLAMPSDLDLNIDIDSLDNTSKNNLIMQFFDYGRYYFIFMNRILSQIINYADISLQQIQSMEEQKGKDEERFNKKLEEMFKIIQLSKFFVTPLPNDKFELLMEKLQKTILDFMEEHSQSTEYHEDIELNWVMAIGLPFSKIRNLEHKKYNL